MLRSSTAFFSALIVGIGALGLVIGGLSLANTVTAAVFERIRDFGVKRALGATDVQLGREILGEALAVTLTGGAVGIALALALGGGVQLYAARSGQQLFLFSPRLLAGALVFAVLLGAVAASYATLRDRARQSRRGDPAWRVMLRAEGNQQVVSRAQRRPDPRPARASICAWRAGSWRRSRARRARARARSLNVLGLLEDAEAGAVAYGGPRGERALALGQEPGPRALRGVRLPVVPPAAVAHRAAERAAGGPLRGPERTGRAPAGGGTARGVRAAAIAATTTRPSCRAASSSAWHSAARCSTIRPCCWPTSPPATSTMPTGASFWRRCGGGPPRGAPWWW